MAVDHLVVADGPFVQASRRHPDPGLAGLVLPPEEWDDKAGMAQPASGIGLRRGLRLNAPEGGTGGAVSIDDDGVGGGRSGSITGSSPVRRRRPGAGSDASEPLLAAVARRRQRPVPSRSAARSRRVRRRQAPCRSQVGG